MQKEIKYCQVCDRYAFYLCGDCKTATYCTNQHRNQHWRVHKEHCKVLQTYDQLKRQQQIKNKRLNFRKHYFQSFNNKIYDKTLLIAQQMLTFQEENIKITRFITNQFQYGITVCLMCRTLILLKKKSQAKIKISEYLKEKQHFLEDLRDIGKFTENQSQITQASKQFLKKKLQLISAVANIFYSLNLPPIHFYTLYLNHVELAFGPQSLQASNCFFLIGTYYMECKQFNKATACFVRAANIRGVKAGDCYYNLAIIYQMRNKNDLAIRFFEYAIKLKQQEQGQNSIEIAKIYQNIAQLQIRNRNFVAAIKSLQKALKIYANKNQMVEFDSVKQRIKNIHLHIKSSVKNQDKSLLPKQLQDQMVQKKINQNNQNQLNADQLSFAAEQKRKQRFVVQNLIKFSQNFLNMLNPAQMYRLSQLQLQLQNCNSQFGVAYTVANSPFLQKLSENRLKQMKIQNQKLFQLMNIQKIPINPIYLIQQKNK